MYFLILILTIVFLGIYLFELKRIKFDTRLIIVIGIFSAIGYILNLFKFIRMPQGGSITFFSMLPVMIITFVHGRGAGLTSGLLLGVLKTLDGVVMVNPLQFILDYLLSNMCLGFSNIFGRKNKIRIFLGCLFSGILCVMFNVLSGVLFFSEFAPEGRNIWIYSLGYNFSSIGVEVLLTSILMAYIPLVRMIKSFNKEA
ncbi:energy-coupled thiamine transporter ThiT [Candidatus Arthromitus sp. SFB-rat-Yit]|uniref:energy-coupled thiamine transporter ThiT n=1 Tax=Candidatus Arthromitus sp. SFB-rat-Yit TaxID=1041504 RepID=UPI000227A6F3|nr:energy-coupled thiamine transporter ThiT [Candidatus Arthromitus sp. SFB-rat-Yit]BAK81705.1 putative proton-coupled thiamine transporter YuaJ [Candidatus Arthromitus sp. SFB-rat-Yit]